MVIWFVFLKFLLLVLAGILPNLLVDTVRERGPVSGGRPRIDVPMIGVGDDPFDNFPRSFD